jgi:hypothetical protein
MMIVYDQQKTLINFGNKWVKGQDHIDLVGIYVKTVFDQ